MLEHPFIFLLLCYNIGKGHGKNMKKQYHVLIYSIIWGFAIIFLIIMLYQNNGNARVINYTGLIRGGSQQLVKQEFFGIHNETLLVELDEILYELQTGEGTHHITPCTSKEYQDQLKDMQIIWEQMKDEIYKVERGGPPQYLFALSEQYFDSADLAVEKAELYAESLIHVSISVLAIYLLVSIACILIWNIHKEQQMKKIYYTDQLTNAYNKSAFEVRVKHIMEVYQYPYSILYFDVDAFKRINDEFGYQAGDQLLKEIAEFLKRTMDDDNECFARPSADNFIVLMRRDLHEIHTLNLELSQYLHNQLEYICPICLTFGIYELPSPCNEQIPTMLDKAMLAHKICKGRRDVNMLYYNGELIKQIEHENRITSNMRKALEQKEYQMYLQPKFDIKTGKVIGAEALVRWYSPELGFLSPDEFIPLFEQNGFITQLDFYMIHQVCDYLSHALIESPDFCVPISVNISRVTLSEQDFLKNFNEVVSNHQVPNHYIEVELTESAFNGIDQNAMEILKQLQENGYQISMDDFGSGYSSLNLLRTMPINVLKLDREFINEQKTSKEASGIISCIINMAHVMKLDVVCEGIETQQQVTMLKEIGCDFGQGYYFAKPMPVDQFIKIYHNQQAMDISAIKEAVTL